MAYWIHDACQLEAEVDPDWGRVAEMGLFEYSSDLASRLARLQLPFLTLLSSPKSLLLGSPFAPVRCMQREAVLLEKWADRAEGGWLYYSFLPECRFRLEQKSDPWGRRMAFNRKPRRVVGVA